MLWYCNINYLQTQERTTERSDWMHGENAQELTAWLKWIQHFCMWLQNLSICAKCGDREPEVSAASPTHCRCVGWKIPAFHRASALQVTEQQQGKHKIHRACCSAYGFDKAALYWEQPGERILAKKKLQTREARIAKCLCWVCALETGAVLGIQVF